MKIYITLDYELFLGNYTGSIDNCIIKPVELLLDLFLRYDVKATFFVDSSYLLRLYELSGEVNTLSQDFSSLVCNLHKIVSLGHDVGLHIHPQWYHAKYSHQWEFVPNLYTLNDLQRFTDSGFYFKNCCALLENITGKEIKSFRAGGYSIQRFDSLMGIFQDNNIFVDSSVLFKGVCYSQFQKYDYSCLSDSDVYKFSDNICIPQYDGQFFELPISTIRIPTIQYLFNKLIKVTNDSIMGDGYSVKDSSPKRLLHRLFNTQTISASFDNIAVHFLFDIYNKYKLNGKNDFCIIGHPKCISLHSLSLFGEFISCAKNNGDNFCGINSLLQDGK